MGSWGFGAFENDDAFDWYSFFQDDPTLSRIERAFHQVLTAAILDIDIIQASEAFAASEIMLALVTQSCRRIPFAEETLESISALRVDKELLTSGIEALDRLRHPECGARNVFGDDTSYATWQSKINETLSLLNVLK